MSPPAAVFLELAALRVSLVDLVIFGDSMVRAQQITPELLVTTVNVSSRGGARLARQAAALVREGSDSAPESRLRLLLVLAGLPEPEINRIIRTADGEWLRRFDLCYPALRLILEYDGRQHADNPRQWNGDILRRESLERQGWTIIVVTADALWREPEQTLDRVVSALRDRHCPGLPSQLDPRWHRYFPSRARN